MELLFPVDVPLSSSQAASLLEAGLTYILYQRGQIPLPYQQLQASSVEHRKLEETSRPAQTPSRQGISEQNAIITSPEVNPRERIAIMLAERKKRLLEIKLQRQKRQALALESKAYNSLQPALDILQQLLNDITRKNLTTSCRKVTVALVLGPSVYSPKETYCFDLPVPCLSDDRNLISKTVAEQNKILRQFYKTIITNGDLMDFTSKPLAKTYAHICLVARADLKLVIHGNKAYQNVVRLSAIPPTLGQAIRSSLLENTQSDGCESTEFSSPNFRKRVNKCFKFKVKYNNCSHESISSYDTLESRNSTNNDDNHQQHESYFSGDILFDNNSFSCYQIPLRFKGVQCKNKRL